MILRMHLNNLFDRNPAFKEKAREALLDYLNHIKKFVQE